jgi:hypothetical protein
VEGIALGNLEAELTIEDWCGWMRGLNLDGRFGSMAAEIRDRDKK